MIIQMVPEGDAVKPVSLGDVAKEREPRVSPRRLVATAGESGGGEGMAMTFGQSLDPLRRRVAVSSGSMIDVEDDRDQLRPVMHEQMQQRHAVRTAADGNA